MLNLLEIACLTLCAYSAILHHSLRRIQANFTHYSSKNKGSIMFGFKKEKKLIPVSLLPCVHETLLFSCMNRGTTICGGEHHQGATFALQGALDPVKELHIPCLLYNHAAQSLDLMIPSGKLCLY